MLRNIMVPLDGTVVAEEALPFAMAVARRTDAEIHPVLVHLTDHFQDLGLRVTFTDQQAESDLMVREEDYLDSVTRRVVAGAVRVHDPVVLRGEVADALTRHVQAQGIDGVVMSTHGRGNLERFLIPSVAEELLHRLTVPMLLHRGSPDAPMRERLESAPPFRTLVAAVDGSADGEEALARGLELVEPDGRVILLRVVEGPPLLSSVYIHHAAVLQREEEERRRSEAREYLDRIVRRSSDGEYAVETRMVARRRVADAVVEVADEEEADLVTLGSHGRGALREALFGSVTHDVLQSSTVPVLVARETKD